MGKRTVEEGYFGSVGMGDPVSAYTDRLMGVSWDFSKRSVQQNKTIPLMMLPRGFCIDRITVVQTKYANKAANLTFGLQSDDSFVVGGTFALAKEGGMLRSSKAARELAVASESLNATSEAVFTNGNDVLCLILPQTIATDGELNKGAFELYIHGFETSGEGYDSGDGVPYRVPIQTEGNVANNVSGGALPID